MSKRALTTVVVRLNSLTLYAADLYALRVMPSLNLSAKPLQNALRRRLLFELLGPYVAAYRDGSRDPALILTDDPLQSSSNPAYGTARQVTFRLFPNMAADLARNNIAPDLPTLIRAALFHTLRFKYQLPFDRIVYEYSKYVASGAVALADTSTFPSSTLTRARILNCLESDPPQNTPATPRSDSMATTLPVPSQSQRGDAFPALPGPVPTPINPYQVKLPSRPAPFDEKDGATPAAASLYRAAYLQARQGNQVARRERTIVLSMHQEDIRALQMLQTRVNAVWGSGGGLSLPRTMLFAMWSLYGLQDPGIAAAGLADPAQEIPIPGMNPVADMVDREQMKMRSLQSPHVRMEVALRDATRVPYGLAVRFEIRRNEKNETYSQILLSGLVSILTEARMATPRGRKAKIILQATSQIYGITQAALARASLMRAAGGVDISLDNIAVQLMYRDRAMNDRYGKSSLLQDAALVLGHDPKEVLALLARVERSLPKTTIWNPAGKASRSHKDPEIPYGMKKGEGLAMAARLATMGVDTSDPDAVNKVINSRDPTWLNPRFLRTVTEADRLIEEHAAEEQDDD